MVRAVERARAFLFSVTVYVTVVGPVPIEGETIAAHPVSPDDAAHGQPPSVERATEPDPAAAENDWLEAAREYVLLQLPPVCVTVKVCPAAVSVPVRDVLELAFDPTV